MRKSTVLTGFGLVAALIVVVLWFSGVFTPGRIGPDDGVAPPSAGPEPAAVAEARTAMIAERYEAVGSVRPRTETSIEAQVAAQILQVHVRPGDTVKRGEALIVLDDRELSSRRDQALQGLQSARANEQQARQNILAAQARFDEAASQYKRITSLYEDGAVAKSEMDRAEAAYLQAEAGLQQAKDGLHAAQAGVRQAQNRVEEAEIALGYAVIEAPETGEVLDRLADPGDLAAPGKPLLLLQTSGAMRLEAMVREGVINRVRPGVELEVEIAALNLGRTMQGVVEEIVPVADPRTRTVLVKVGLPDVAGLYPGMFGRVYIPLDPRPAVLVDKSALRRVGQMDTVRVLDGEVWRQVYVKVGPERGQDVEILSGLEGGETVGLPTAGPDAPATAN